MTLRQRVEENIVIWLLGTLFSGFLAGLSAYKAVHEMAGLEPTSKAAQSALEQKVKALEEAAKNIQESQVSERRQAEQALSSCRSDEAARYTLLLQAAEASLASCRDALKVTKSTKDTDDRRKPRASEISEIRFFRLCMVYRDHHSVTALAMRKELEQAGVEIYKFIRISDDKPRGTPRTIFYRSEESLPEALGALNIWREYGFIRVELAKEIEPCQLMVPLTW